MDRMSSRARDREAETEVVASLSQRRVRGPDRNDRVHRPSLIVQQEASSVCPMTTGTRTERLFAPSMRPRSQAPVAALFHPERALVVVAGDPDALAPVLVHFGEVTIVDPTRDFQTMKTLPQDGSASLEPATPKSQN